MTRPRILLTGATGVLGAVLVDELAPVADLTCLVRSRPVPAPGIRQVRGDLTSRHLGLDAATWRELVARTDVVLHCGAATGFGRSAAVPQRVNVEGTERVLDLAARAGARVVHVSTAFVARAGEFSEGDREGLRSPAGYLASKQAAEAAVRDSGLDAVVVRPAVLTGAAETGEIAAFQGWHAMCGGVITGQVPFLPAAGSALIDTVPVDLAARAVAAIVLGDHPGREWWLTAGEEALSLTESVGVCLDVAAEAGLAPHPPRMMPRETVERLVLPAFAASAPRPLREQVLEAVELMRLFGSETAFPSRWPDPSLAPRRADLARWAAVSLRAWCEAQGLLGAGLVAEEVA